MSRAALGLLTTLVLAAPLTAESVGVSPPRPPHLPSDRALVLAGPGVRSVIVLPDPRPGEKYRFPWWEASVELAGYAKIITGHDIPVRRASEMAGREGDHDVRIWVGRQPRVDAAFGRDLDRLDDDGFVIRAAGADLFLAGKFNWGDHWAVHDLFERFAGCRWYLHHPWMPDDIASGRAESPGVILPRAPRLAVPRDVNLVEQPAYRARFLRHMPWHSFRVRPRDAFSHNLHAVVSAERHGRDHPEYFPLVKGRRLVPGPGQDVAQACVSHPDVVRLAVAAARRHFDDHPDAGTFSLGMNDNDGFCECDACLRLAPPEVKGTPARTAWAYFDFINRVAREVARTHPGKRLGCLAYARLSLLPAGNLRLEPNVVPYLTRDSAQLFDPGERAEFRELVDRWSGMAARMGIYEYAYGQGFAVPRLYNRHLLGNIRGRYGVRCDGFYAEDYPHWGLDGLKYYLVCKLLWNPDQDPVALEAEMLQSLFGPAAAPMRDYFRRLEDAWCSQTLPSTRSNYRWYFDPRQFEILAPHLDRAGELLDGARAAADRAAASVTDPEQRRYCGQVRERVEFFRSAFVVSRALTRRHTAALAVETAARDKAPPAATLAALETWAAESDWPALYRRATEGSDALYPMPLPTFRGHFDRPAPIVRAVTALREEVAGDRLVRAAPATVEAARAAVCNEFDRSLAGTNAPRAAALLRRLFAERAFLIASRPARAPTIDGRLDREEWGPPAFAGRFLAPHSLDDEQPVSTTVWAAADDRHLYLALDCPQDPAVITTRVTGRDTDPGAYPKMAGDDAVSLTFTTPGAGYTAVRVNAAGAVQGSAATAAVAARRPPTGWQAELSLPRAALHLDNPSTRLAIARYAHVPVPKGSGGDPPPPRLTVGVLNPVPDLEGVIGRGNHAACMVFITGVPVLLPAPRP